MAKVAWIGVGNMGKPMSTNLLKAGHEVTVTDKKKDNAAEVIAAGAKWADSAAEAAKGAEFVFTMIPDGKVLQQVALGEKGYVSVLQPGMIVVDMSTVAPEESLVVNEAIEAKGCKFLRGPVTGSTVLAASASIGILCSGDKATYDKTLPLFQAMGKNQFYLGAGEEARYMKLALNMMIGTSMQMMAESLVFGERAGLDWAQMIEVIAGSAVASPLVQYKAKPVTNRDYTPAFSVKLMEKDFDLALSAAKDLDVSLPVTAMTRQFLAAARCNGKADKDFASLVELAEEFAGMK